MSRFPVSLDDKVAVFAHDRLYPAGGWGDMIFAGTVTELYNQLEDIRKKAEGSDNYEVVNLTTLQEISFGSVESLFTTDTLFP